MTGMERAKRYVGIFIGAGDKWRSCVPLDHTPGDGDVIYLQGVEMRRIDADTWELTENAETITLKRAVEVTS
jgi:hypothetical protein